MQQPEISIHPLIGRLPNWKYIIVAFNYSHFFIAKLIIYSIILQLFLFYHHHSLFYSLYNLVPAIKFLSLAFPTQLSVHIFHLSNSYVISLFSVYPLLYYITCIFILIIIIPSALRHDMDIFNTYFFFEISSKDLIQSYHRQYQYFFAILLGFFSV